jgi:hypothetical protein
MNEPYRTSTQDVGPRGCVRQRARLPVEAIRDCLTPILTSTVIARSLCDDRKAKLALEIIERQAQRLAHLLKDAYGVDAQMRLD